MTLQALPTAPLVLEALSREYVPGTPALHPINLTLPKSHFLAIMGPSGCGKSTLLQCAAGLDRPTAGKVRLAGTDLSTLKEKSLTRLRRDRIGFVFQDHNLIESLTVKENVALPLLLAGTTADVTPALTAVGLADRPHALPSELSGGQRQRVAIARALVTEPEVVFADEPTGALDPGTADQILALLRQAVDQAGRTVVMVTHDPSAAAWSDEVLFLSRGRVAGRLDHPGPTEVRRVMTGLVREGAAA